MDYDLMIRLGTFLVGAIGAWKIRDELVRGRRGHLREEYRFAREFLRDLTEDAELHPYLKEKGYQAMAGDTELSTGEMEYLLALHHPAQALSSFVLGRKYIQHLATATDSQIVFKEKFIARWSRLWRKIWYFALYCLCYSLGVAPILFSTFGLTKTPQMLGAFALTALVFFPAGFFAIREGVRIARAETLVREQYKHARSLVRP